MWDASSGIRDQIHIPCIGRQILNYWTTREVPLKHLRIPYSNYTLTFTYSFQSVYWVPLHASHCFQHWCFKTCTFFKRTQWIKYISLWVFLLSSAFSSTMIFQKEAIYWELRGHQGEGNGTPLQYSCLENPMDRGAWWAVVHEVTKSRTRLRDFTFTFHFLALEKEMATHSSVLAWRIPGTGEPGGLTSMGSHRVRHDWSDLAAARGHLPEVSENPTAFYLRVYFYPRAYQLKSLKEWHLSRNCIPRAELHVLPAPSHWGQ